MKQKAVIVDIDGTISNSPHVAQFTSPEGKVDWEAWISSTRFAPINEWCKEICVAMQRRGYRLIFMTARSSNFNGHEITREWLNNHLNSEGIFEYELMMRPKDDFRPDSEIKQDLYWTSVYPHYDVLFAVDDKHNIIDLWRNLNIPALHCADY
jgi:predicted secreted acid phosphatase